MTGIIRKYEPIFEMTAKYGMPYFQNSYQLRYEAESSKVNVPPAPADLRELLKRGNGLFGSAEMTGSLGVVTLNSARIGFVHKGNKEAFLKRIEHLMYLAKTSLEIKRKEINKWLDKGLFPLYQKIFAEPEQSFFHYRHKWIKRKPSKLHRRKRKYRFPMGAGFRRRSLAVYEK